MAFTFLGNRRGWHTGSSSYSLEILAILEILKVRGSRFFQNIYSYWFLQRRHLVFIFCQFPHSYIESMMRYFETKNHRANTIYQTWINLIKYSQVWSTCVAGTVRRTVKELCYILKKELDRICGPMIHTWNFKLALHFLTVYPQLTKKCHYLHDFKHIGC